MLRITKIEKGSPAYASEFRAEDSIVSINGNTVSDALDFNFYSADDELLMILVRNGSEIVMRVSSADLEGIETEDLKIKHCGNKCIFCFIDQNPQGMRRTIYVKDEDYRYSFLYGNYFTLTNLSGADLERIAKMRLSPLYVSVHATDPAVRKKLLGIKKEDGFEKKLRFLADSGIEIHTQIVVCPGINDGDVLKKTVSDLSGYFPAVRSVAVVPVGLTEHRDGLARIEPFTANTASETLDIIKVFNKKFRKDMGTSFVFGSDELYLKAGRQFPGEEYYEDYLQYEDGIGMSRFFIERFYETAGDLPRSVRNGTKIKIVTGTLFFDVLKNTVLPEFEKIKGLKVELTAAENTLFGKSVTVAGLLSGKDIIMNAGKAEKDCDILLIPSTVLNTDGLFLDGLAVRDVEKSTGYRVFCLENPSEVFERL